MSDRVRSHLPELPVLEALSRTQNAQLEEFAGMLLQFNRRINLVSREAEDDVAQRHIPHVAALAQRRFPEGSVVVDWGTGGGLPAIPLATVFPTLEVHAVDAVEKKVLAVRTMARRLGLANLHAWTGDAMQWPGLATHSVSRATAPLATLWSWHARIAKTIPSTPGEWAPGLLCLKGGELEGERAELSELCTAKGLPTPIVDVLPLREMFDDPYFAAKHLLYVHLIPS